MMGNDSLTIFFGLCTLFNFLIKHRLSEPSPVTGGQFHLRDPPD